MEGGFLLLFLRKGQADLGLMPRSQNHRLRAEKALSYQAGILSLGVHVSPKIIFKIVASAFTDFIRFSEVYDPTKS